VTRKKFGNFCYKKKNAVEKKTLRGAVFADVSIIVRESSSNDDDISLSSAPGAFLQKYARRL